MAAGKTTFIKNLLAPYAQDPNLKVNDASGREAVKVFSECPEKLATNVLVNDHNSLTSFHYVVQDTPGARPLVEKCKLLYFTSPACLGMTNGALDPLQDSALQNAYRFWHRGMQPNGRPWLPVRSASTHAKSLMCTMLCVVNGPSANAIPIMTLSWDCIWTAKVTVELWTSKQLSAYLGIGSKGRLEVHKTHHD